MSKMDSKTIVLTRDGFDTRHITTQSNASDPSQVAVHIFGYGDSAAWAYLPKAEALELINDLIALVADLD